MHNNNRVFIWDTYRQRANKLWGDVEYDLHHNFALIKGDKTDDDTPYVKQLFDMLTDINAFISEHLDTLEHQVSTLNI